MSAVPDGAPTATPRAEPWHCPYCGLDELRPAPEENAWHCRSCARVFALRFLAVRRELSTSPHKYEHVSTVV